MPRCQVHGPLPGYAEQEQQKQAAYAVMAAPASSVQDLVGAAEQLLRAWFARSVLGSALV